MYEATRFKANSINNKKITIELQLELNLFRWFKLLFIGAYDFSFSKLIRRSLVHVNEPNGVL